MDRCDQCGFAYDSVQPGEVAAEVRSLPAQFAEQLRAAGETSLARTRPQPETWSALEYACHLRDVFRFQRERVGLALTASNPLFQSMRRDERAIEERYNEQDVESVLAELDREAEDLAAALDGLDGAQWDRTGIYPYPEPTQRSLAWVARHSLHEGRHHLQDVVLGLGALRGAQSAG
jgi:hypothetical protein